MARCPYCKRRFDSQEAVNGHLSSCKVRGAETRSGVMRGYVSTYYDQVAKHFQKEDIPAMIVGVLLGIEAAHNPAIYPQIAALVLPVLAGGAGAQRVGRLRWARDYVTPDRLPAFMLFLAVGWLGVNQSHLDQSMAELARWILGGGA